MFFISCKDLMLYNQFYLLNVIAYMYLFVYGTLLSTEYNHQTIKSSKLVGEGNIYGKLFDIGNYPALKKGEGIIVGELYYIDDLTLKNCDQLEGYNQDDPENSPYIRKSVTVFLGNKKLCAYVYYCNFDTSNYKEIESGDYKEYMNDQRKR